MLKISYKNDNEADERLNPAAAKLNEAEKSQPGNLNDGDDKSSQENLADQESSSPSPINYQPGGIFKQQTANKLLRVAKSRGGIIGVLSLLGVSGGLMIGLFGPGTMLFNIMENMTLGNDSSTTVMERRFKKVFSRMMNSDGLCSAKKMKCRMGKISNNTLSRLAKKGITPVFDDGSSLTSRKGYPTKNPTSYSITHKGQTTHVPAKEMPDFLNRKENRAIAAKVYGRFGAINMRFRAWTGKYIGKKLYRKFALSRTGNIAKGARAKVSELMSRFREKLPGSERINRAADAAKAKLDKQSGKFKRGGVAYLLAAGGCIVAKAPRYITAAVASVQLAQIMPYVMEWILAPGSKAKAAADGSGFTSEEAENIGNVLTQKGKRESDGKMTSALDSKYLLAAMGVVTTKLPVSEKFTPGLSVMRNSTIKSLSQIEDNTKGACNVILSPSAMYSAMAIDAAVTVAASATIIGGLVKYAATIAISIIIEEAGKAMLGSAIKGFLTDLVSNDLIAKAENEELGDVIGLSSMAFFSAGGSARHLPILRRSSLKAFNDMKRDNEQMHKEMEIASLSPLDTRSRHTFLGSILFNTRSAMIQSGNLNNSASSILANIINMPSIALNFSSTAKAANNFSNNYCGYAEEFDMVTMVERSDGTVEDKTPSMNVMGMGCPGITGDQDDMESEEAHKLVADTEGWTNEEDVDIEDEDDIVSLIDKGYIKKDTPLMDYIEECSNPESGDYIFNIAGCVAEDGATAQKASEANSVKYNECREVTDEDGNTTDICASDMANDSTDNTGVKDTRSLNARMMFLIDYQIKQGMDGNDEEDNVPGHSQGVMEDNQQDTPSSPDDLPPSDGWSWPIVDGAKPGPCWGRNVDSLGKHAGMDINSSVPNVNVYAMHAGKVTRVNTNASGPAGKYVQIRADNGMYYMYQHLNSVRVKVGDTVKSNQVVGNGGKTGRVFARSSPVHLHLVVARDGQIPSYNNLKTSIDPMRVLPSPPPNGYKCT